MARTAGSSTDYLIPTGIRFGEGVRWSRGFFGQWNGKAGPVTHVPRRPRRFHRPGQLVLQPERRHRGGQRICSACAPRRIAASARPTLNELYRTFRAGNAVTNANPDLLPEKLFGAEAGFDMVGETRRFSVTVFRNSLDDVITNVTLSTTPALTTRQRQNAATAVTHGVEANLRQNLGQHWQGELSYLFADSRYATGLRIPQVAKQQGSASLAWIHTKTFISGRPARLLAAIRGRPEHAAAGRVLDRAVLGAASA